MKEEQLHLVPQAVLDCADTFINNKNSLNIDIHRHRLEVIRDFCQEALDKVDGNADNVWKNHRNDISKRLK